VAWGLRHVSSRELSEWMAFFAVEPMPEARADARMAVLASLIANAHRNEEARAQPFAAEEFMPRYWDDAETAGQDDVDEEERMQRLLRKVEMLNAAFGGVDKRRRKSK